MIEIKQLTKRFGAFTAVDGISFNVERGEVLGFLGPNGAGKSTTMKMVSGFLPPTSGTAAVCGHDVLGEPLAVKHAIGYLPEGAPAYPDMTPEAFLSFAAQARGFGRSERKKRIAAMFERVQLAGVMRQPIETLSKGYKRRVGLAQALLHDPDVLILDEPTDGLDPNQKHEVRELIRGLGSDKVIVLSTHILEEVEAVCSRAVIISRGRIVADDTPANLQARSRTHNAVRVRVGAQANGVASTIEALPGVASVDKLEGGELRVRPSDGKSIAAAVGEHLRSKGVEITELRVETGRLDEVFRDLTEAKAGGAQ
jgi:ABC-2 type transport system ATP-binding protein